ncbi:MAG: response regulator [Bacteroidota bacterium]|nr:response regulator [Bacteroidota bacterium]
MLVFGTQMHVVTFIFVSIETVIFFYLLIYHVARPDDRTIYLNLILIFLLITYNISGGLLPDPKLPGSYFIQEAIAYATGFITPCYFPYYVYKAFNLERMKFHAFRGVHLFLLLPYLLFVLIFAISNNLETAKNILLLPVLYAVWVIYSLLKAIKYKYGNNFRNRDSKEEIAVLLVSISPWIGLPVIAYFNLSQVVEALVCNAGFLLLFGLQVSRHVKQIRREHERLIDSEQRLLNWNTNLQNEVNKRTRELEKMNEQKTNNFINLVHETKTPLTLVNNYLGEYITKYGAVEELDIIKGGINKLTKDVTSLFDIERFKKGFEVYSHNQVSDFSEILKESLVLFEYYCQKQTIVCKKEIEENIFIKADPNAIDRIVNNLIENALKFSTREGNIFITLKTNKDKILFSVKDTGMGIPREFQKKIFEPYYQVNHKKTGLQGMGLGLPIVKKVVDGLGGQIQIESHPEKAPGTKISIIFKRYKLEENKVPVVNPDQAQTLSYNFEPFDMTDTEYHPGKPSILLIEDNQSMLKFLSKKFRDKYNAFCTLNGAEALKKLHELTVIPDLILSDIMMDKMDGFAFAKAIAEQEAYNHIPIIFLSAKSTPSDKLKGLRSGAIDLIQKPFSFEVLSQKIETVLENIRKQKRALLNSSISHLKSLDNSETDQVDSASSRFDQTCNMYRFTNREKEIARSIVKGHTYKMIGETLFISEKTVAKHSENIFRKIGATNKVDLVNKLGRNPG